MSRISHPDKPSALKTRFAPSPTGHLHVGHAAAAWAVWDDAEQDPSRFILRIENIDETRCRPEFESSILDDLTWLGLSWPTPVRRQSEYFEDYKTHLETLAARGLTYPCFCTRKDIAQESENAQSAQHGPNGLIYPGHCRHLSPVEQREQMEAGTPYAIRLNLEEALAQTGHKALKWRDAVKGPQETTPEILREAIGDVVLARKDTPASYHLCVTYDDALQGITHITRGEDLFFATHIHRLLQEICGFPVPTYHHHPLLVGPDGRRFAKRDKSLTLKELRNKGLEPNELRHIIAQRQIGRLFDL